MSPPSPTRLRGNQIAVIGLAVALVALAGAIVALHPLGGTTYRYEAVQVEPASDGLDVDANGILAAAGDEPGIAGIDCYTLAHRTRLCALERSIVDDPIAVSRAEYGGYGGGPAERYAHHDGQFYRRYVEERGAELVVGLEPVSSRTVLRNVSTDATSIPEALRPALDGETVTTRRNVSVPERIVAGEDGYYLFQRVGDASTGDQTDESTSGGAWTPLLAGVVGLIVAAKAVTTLRRRQR